MLILLECVAIFLCIVGAIAAMFLGIFSADPTIRYVISAALAVAAVALFAHLVRIPKGNRRR